MNKTHIIFATKNNGKFIEFKRYFENLTNLFDIMSLNDISENLPDFNEIGVTFKENAKDKVKDTRKKLSSKFDNYTIIADDSGMTIDALNGEPGVYTRRWKGYKMTDLEIIDHCLLLLLNQKNRNASYVSCFAISIPNKKIKIIKDESRGVILNKQNISSFLPGMPFRSLFYVPELKMMFHKARELNNNELNNYHLGHNEAMKKIIEYLTE